MAAQTRGLHPGKKPRIWWQLAFGILMLVSTRFAAAQGEAGLNFVEVPGQSPFAVTGDPTVRPMVSNGGPASIFRAAAADLAGSGRADLVACHGTSPPFEPEVQPCRILRPQTNGTLLEATRATFGAGALPSRVNPRSIVVAEFNGVANPDVFVAATGYDADPFPGETNMLLLSGAGGTTSDASSNLPQIADYTHDACSGDIDADGDLDVYVGSFRAPYLLFNNGAGQFIPVSTGLPPDIATVVLSFTACRLIDANADGAAELALGQIAPNGSTRSLLLPNDGTGRFNTMPRSMLPTGSFGDDNTIVVDMDAYDVNRDGRDDLLLSSTTFSNTGMAIQLLVNAGNGTFVDETSSRIGPSAIRTTGSPCGSLLLADLNLDARADIFCGDGPDTTHVRYWMSRPTGTYLPVAPGALTQGAGLGVQSTDFDADGRLDLVWLRDSPMGDINYKVFLNRTIEPTLFANGFEP